MQRQVPRPHSGSLADDSLPKGKASAVHSILVLGRPVIDEPVRTVDYDVYALSRPSSSNIVSARDSAVLTAHSNVTLFLHTARLGRLRPI